MRQEKIQSIRNALVEKMETLWSITEDTIAKMKNTDGKYADSFDQAAIESNNFVELACLERERLLMLDIKKQLCALTEVCSVFVIPAGKSLIKKDF